MGYTEATEILDAEKGMGGVAELYSWSTNYDHPTPFALFLDLIGWSDEHVGEPLFDLRKVPERLGYLELGQLAKALDEYSDTPSPVTDAVNRAMEAEMGD